MAPRSPGRALLAVLLLTLPGPARGDELADGEALARAGRFEEAIAHFKALDAKGERAIHACYVALAYRRLERWGQAELHADRCRARARAGDPEPSWARQLRADIEAGIARRRGARVTFTVEPPDAELSVSAFAPDERFGARTVYLPLGEHRVTAVAPGSEYDRQVEVVSVTGSDPVAVHLVLPRVAPPRVEPAPEKAPEKPQPEPEPAPRIVVPPPAPAAPRASRSPWPVIALSAGGASLAAGVVFHVLAAGKRADAEESPAAYAAAIDAFKRDRAIAIGAYAVAAVAVGTGVVLLLTSRTAESPPPRVGLAPLGAGGVLTVIW